MKKRKIVEWLSQAASSEVCQAKLGDERLSARAGKMVDSLCERPKESFPQALGSASAAEAGYRLFRNERVTAGGLLEPHFEGTCQRISSQRLCLVIHDTTSFEFSGESNREGLGWVVHTKGKKTQGFFGHFALAVSADEMSVPLGLVGLLTFVRNGPPAGRAGGEKRKKDPNRESLRWGKMVDDVEARLNSHVIHVMDREADDYGLICRFFSTGSRFIVRMKADRRIEHECEAKAFDVIGKAEDLCEREVPISCRKRKPGWHSRRKHPPRKARSARLAFSATKIKIRCPKSKRSEFPQVTEVNVVRVREIDAPQGCEPVEWKLLTNESIETKEDILSIVDSYRRRWTIEDYFKAIKTGCAFEKRQLESLDALCKALALLAPVAWRLLLLRNVGRALPDMRATLALENSHLEVLRVMGKVALSDNPTMREAMLAIGAMGGHLKQNGDPGWQVLGRGYQRLLTLEHGWSAARKHFLKNVINA